MKLFKIRILIDVEQIYISFIVIGVKLKKMRDYLKITILGGNEAIFYRAQVRARHFYARQFVHLTTEIFFDYLIVFLAV